MIKYPDRNDVDDTNIKSKNKIKEMIKQDMVEVGTRVFLTKDVPATCVEKTRRKNKVTYIFSLDELQLINIDPDNIPFILKELYRTGKYKNETDIIFPPSLILKDDDSVSFDFIFVPNSFQLSLSIGYSWYNKLAKRMKCGRFTTDPIPYRLADGAYVDRTGFSEHTNTPPRGTIGIPLFFQMTQKL